MTHRFTVAACVAVAFLLFCDVLLTSTTVVPTGHLYEREPWRSMRPEYQREPAGQYDLLFQFLPWARHFRQEVLQGDWPLWERSTYLGTPFLANPQNAVFFPLTWLHLLAAPEQVFGWILFLKLLFFLLGTTLFLRSYGLSPLACLTGALAGGLSMHFVVSLAFPYSSVQMLFPWALWAVRGVIATPKPARILWLSLLLSAIVLAGQPQSALLAFFFLTLFTLFELSSSPWWKSRERRFPALGALALAAASASLISAPQWVPALEYFRESLVGEGPVIARTGIPNPLSTFLTLLVPDFFGRPENGVYWGFTAYPISIFYSSLLVLLLALLARSSKLSRQARGLWIFSWLMFGLCTGILLGLPGLESLLEVPGFDLVKRSKWSLPWLFALATLAALGMETLQRAGAKALSLRSAGFLFLTLLLPAVAGWWHFREFIETFDSGQQVLWSALQAFLVLAAGLTLLCLPYPRFRAPGLALLLTLDLTAASFGLNPRGRPEALFPPLSETATELTEHHRVLALQDLLTPNSALIYGLRDPRGYDAMTPRRLFHFMRQLDPALGDVYSHFELLEREGIHAHTLMLRGFESALKRYGTPLEKYLRSDVFHLFRVEDVIREDLLELLNIQVLFTRGLAPPGFQCRRASRDQWSICENPSARDFAVYSDWASTPRLEEPPPLGKLDLCRPLIEGSLPLPPATAPDGQADIRIVSETSRARHFDVRTSHPVVLVEFERYAPGWKAYVDGSRQEVLPAHFLFRGVYLPAGVRRLEMRYEPGSFYTGLVLAALGLLLLGGAAIHGRRESGRQSVSSAQR